MKIYSDIKFKDFNFFDEQAKENADLFTDEELGRLEEILELQYGDKGISEEEMNYLFAERMFFLCTSLGLYPNDVYARKEQNNNFDNEIEESLKNAGVKLVK